VVGLTAEDAILVVVPLFHANAWGLPFAGAASGTKLILPGPRLDGESLFRLMSEEGATTASGVPTVWFGFFDYVERNRAQLDLSRIRLKTVLVGGSAAPRALIKRFDETFGTFLVHAWGMTETSPIATTGKLLAKHAGLDREARYDVQARQGRAVFGVELKITDDEGRELPRDGKAVGHVKVRGPWVTAGYFKGEGGEVLDAEGWFDTGDVGTIDADGYLTLVDRAKDLIKSGGEWISSIDLENAAVAHPDVLEAAAIGVAHPKWVERPLLLIVCREGATVSREDMLAFLADKVAKWWLPDDVVVVDALPHTATGKLSKATLRKQYADYFTSRLGAASPAPAAS
jgi:fatty-acyl-CoA synthase